MKGQVKNLFWSIKNSGEVLNKLKSRGFRATSLSTYDFSTLYTTLPHNLIKEKLINLIEWTFKREGSPYIACNERLAFFTSEDTKRYKLWSCQNVCEALIYLLDNIYIRFGTKLYRQIVGIPMGTNCAGERGGSVVDCRTLERKVGGSIPTAAVLCPWARHFTPRKYWLITQEAVAPSRHDWKIVDWDVKPQHKHKQKLIVLPL